jgi:hypothetical protein
MTGLVTLVSRMLPALITGAGERVQRRFLKFFAAKIRNPHTRRAYVRAAGEFLEWCAAAGVVSVTDVAPLDVAAWIEVGILPIPSKR